MIIFITLQNNLNKNIADHTISIDFYYLFNI